MPELFYQDFNEQFEGYTQPNQRYMQYLFCCFIRISMNNLKDIHNLNIGRVSRDNVVLSGFQWTIWRIYTTIWANFIKPPGCFIRISMNNLKDIHNQFTHVLLAFWLFYQDFNEQFEGYTQRVGTRQRSVSCCFIRISMNNLKDIHNLHVKGVDISKVVLSGFQWTIWRIYTTSSIISTSWTMLFYQDFNEQFEGYTQLGFGRSCRALCCFIRISMNNLKDIHNFWVGFCAWLLVVLSGFQWTIWRIYTTSTQPQTSTRTLFYQDFKDTFVCNTQHQRQNISAFSSCFIKMSMNNSAAKVQKK